MRILAVDDERLALMGLKRAIKKAAPQSAEIEGFQFPTAALEYARDHPPDVAFLDMELPGMHGLILARKLQELNAKVNIVFVSAGSNPAYAMEAFRLRASGYVQKPVDSGRLMAEFGHLRYAVGE